MYVTKEPIPEIVISYSYSLNLGLLARFYCLILDNWRCICSLCCCARLRDGADYYVRFAVLLQENCGERRDRAF